MVATALGLLMCTAVLPADDAVTGATRLEELRRTGDLPSERRHAWDLLARLTQPGLEAGQPSFESWYGENAVFAKAGAVKAPAGMHDFSHSHSAPGSSSADIPLLTYTLYNAAAYTHIRTHRLYSERELRRLARRGRADESIEGDRSIPDFPSQAMVLKTVWWPVAKHGSTVLPVWDPEHNLPRASGNDYTTWQRVVVVRSPDGPPSLDSATVDFAGNSFRSARVVATDDFHYIRVDKPLARRLNHDPSASKVALIALGRAVEAGDYLVLVAANLATKEIEDWVWAAIWWHDAADESGFSSERPAGLSGAWRHYLLEVAFDEERPAATDGGAHICFSPWLEARFPDGGGGNGTVGNCLACHRRASYPAVNFLPVTRGAPDLAHDPAYAAGRLRTDFLWSIALHSRH